VRKICDKYLDKGAESVILGCTEFAVMLGDDSLKVNTIDVLVEATIKHWLMRFD
jgi:aspartate/glutamate racemase